MLAPHRVLTLVTVCALALGTAGCGKEGVDPAADHSAPASAASGAPSAGASTQPADTEHHDSLAAPTDAPDGTPFTLDQAARYDDGVLVEIESAKVAKAEPKVTGAEGTNGELIIATVVITNQSQQPFGLDKVQIDGWYAGVGAPKVLDPSGKLGDSMKGSVPAGGSARASIGFAMPHVHANDITIVVDGGDDAHGPLMFSGAAS